MKYRFTAEIRGSLKRWLDILMMTISAVAITTFCYPVLHILSDRTSNLLEACSFTGVLISLTALATLFTLFLAEARGFNLRNLRPQYLLAYPPCWLAGLLGAMIFSISMPLLFEDQNAASHPASAWPWVALVLFVGAVCAWGVQWLARPDSAIVSTGYNYVPATSLEDLWEDPVRLIGWMEREQPIAAIEDDFFAMASLSSRLADRLTRNPNATLAVVGEYGSGKSSLIALVETRLHRGQWFSCHVGGWGVAANNTVEHLLERVLDILCQHVDCLSLKSLPGRYRAALSGAHGTISKFVHPFMQTEEPVDVLKRLDAVLAPIGRNCLIVLEDLDRDKTDPGLSRRLADLSALLIRLRDLKRISFVLAVGSGVDSAIDLPKLCEFVEWIPPIGAAATGKILRAFFDHCLSQFPGDVAVVSRQKSAIEMTKQGLFFHGSGDSAEAKLVGAMSKLLSTPRLLKYCLRRSWSAWLILHGEISLTDLLVVNALRAGAPEAFEFLLLSYERVHDITDSMLLALSSGTDRQTKLRAELHNQFKNVRRSSNWDVDIASHLMEYVLPAWSHSVTDDDGAAAASEQRVWSRRYWRRLLSELSPVDPDQPFLRRLVPWIESGRGQVELAQELTTSEESAAKFEQFARLLAEDTAERQKKVLALASAVFERILHTSGAAANRDEAPGFLAMWRIAIRTYDIDRPHVIARFALREIARSLPRSLRFALDIEYYWAASDSVRAVDEQDALRVRRGLVARARRIFSNADQLIIAIDSTSPYTLHWLIRSFHLKLKLPDQDWSWLVPIMLQAAFQNPQALVPQLSVLVSHSETIMTGRRRQRLIRHELDDKFISNLFPARAEQRELFTLLSKDIEVGALAENEQALVRAVREEAMRRISRTGGED